MATKIVTTEQETGSCYDQSGIKIEGDLRDLQIIEESESSDDEACGGHVHNCGVIDTIPKGLVQEISTPVFGSVAVSNSENVHFGNNTYYNGPVTIKQVIQPGSGIDNATYQKTEKVDVPSGDYYSKNVNSDKKVKIKVWHKLSITAGSVALLASVCTILIISLREKGSSESSHFEASKPTVEQQDPDSLLISAEHLRIVSRTDWLAQPQQQGIEPIRRPVPWVIITHTATEGCFVQSECVLRVRLMQTYHIESKGWSDIAYNFMVGGDGSAYYGRGWDQIGSHTKGYNKYAISIAFIGTFNTVAPTKHQVKASANLINLGVANGKLAADYKLLTHRQLMSTLSPGDQVYNIVKTWPHFYNDTDISKILPKY